MFAELREQLAAEQFVGISWDKRPFEPNILLLRCRIRNGKRNEQAKQRESIG